MDVITPINSFLQYLLGLAGILSFALYATVCAYAQPCIWAGKVMYDGLEIVHQVLISSLTSIKRSEYISLACLLVLLLFFVVKLREQPPHRHEISRLKADMDEMMKKNALLQHHVATLTTVCSDVTPLRHQNALLREEMATLKEAHDDISTLKEDNTVLKHQVATLSNDLKEATTANETALQKMTVATLTTDVSTLQDESAQLKHQVAKLTSHTKRKAKFDGKKMLQVGESLAILTNANIHFTTLTRALIDEQNDLSNEQNALSNKIAALHKTTSNKFLDAHFKLNKHVRTFRNDIDFLRDILKEDIEPRVLALDRVVVLLSEHSDAQTLMTFADDVMPRLLALEKTVVALRGHSDEQTLRVFGENVMPRLQEAENAIAVLGQRSRVDTMSMVEVGQDVVERLVALERCVVAFAPERGVQRGRK